MAYVRGVGDDSRKLGGRWVKNEVSYFHVPKVGISQSRLTRLSHNVRVYVPPKKRKFKPMQLGVTLCRTEENAFTKCWVKELFRLVS